MTGGTDAFVYTPPSADPLVLAEDDHILVVSKPSGLLSVPGRLPQHQDSALLRLERTHGSLGVVHRLDMDTSGLLVFAKTDPALRALHKQFSQRTVEKSYLAWVHGVPSEAEGVIDQPLICDWPNRPQQIIDHDIGKPSQTAWRVVSEQSDYAEVQLTPITGRSHQLRVHMAWLRHPILGDRFYAAPKAQNAANRLMLHASAISFDHPNSGERITLIDQSENRLEQRHLIV